MPLRPAPLPLHPAPLPLNPTPVTLGLASVVPSPTLVPLRLVPLKVPLTELVTAGPASTVPTPSEPIPTGLARRGLRHRISACGDGDLRTADRTVAIPSVVMFWPDRSGRG